MTHTARLAAAAVVLLVTTAPVVAQPAAPTLPSGPAEMFAADLTARGRLGWRVRHLEVRDGREGLALAVTMASPPGQGARALEYVLRFGGDHRTVRDYRVDPVPVPDQARVYPAERELLALLEHAAPRELYEECGSYYLETGHGGVGVDASSYYLVSDRVSGFGADQALATALATALEDGLALTGVSEVGAGDEGGHRIDVELVGSTRRVLHVGTDQHDRVILLEVRESPDGIAWQTFRGARSLLETVRRGRAVRTLALDPEPDGPGRLLGAMLGGYRLEVALDDFELGDHEDGCGC